MTSRISAIIEEEVVRISPNLAVGVKGDKGDTGVVAATAPLEYDDETETVSLSVGTGLTTSGGALVPDFGTGAGKVAQGNDSRLSDARTPTAHASSHAAAGSDPLTLTVAQLVGLIGHLNMETTAVDTMPRWAASASIAPTSGNIQLMHFTPLWDLTVSSIAMQTHNTAASGLTAARMGLYTIDGSGYYTLVARTASDTSLFGSTATLYTRSFDTAGGYPSSYALVAGTRYAVGVICVGTTMPTLLCSQASNTIPILNTVTPVMCTARAGQTDLITPINTLIGTSSRNYWARLA